MSSLQRHLRDIERVPPPNLWPEIESIEARPLLPEPRGRQLITAGVALVVVLLFAALQWRGIRWGSFTQNLTSLIKTLVFSAIALAAFTIALARAPRSTAVAWSRTNPIAHICSRRR